VPGINIGTALFFLLFSAFAKAEPQFDPKLCKDTRLVSKEMVEYHLAGAHWQGGVSRCLDQKNFKTLLSEHQSAGDSSLLTPTFVVPKGAEVKIESEKELDLGGVEVRFSFRAKKGDEKKLLQDSLIYIWNAPRIRKRDGCAAIYVLPAYFAVREECLK
jgi:hypothetical protein